MYVSGDGTLSELRHRSSTAWLRPRHRATSCCRACACRLDGLACHALVPCAHTGGLVTHDQLLSVNLLSHACRPSDRILSAVRQQRFMATPGGLRPVDVTAVVNRISAVVRIVLQPVSVGDVLTVDESLELLSKMHSGVPHL